MPAGAIDGVAGQAMNFILIGGIVIMFVFMIFSQRKKEKKAKEMLDAIKVGDHIRTIGGFYGKVSAVKQDIFVIEVGPDKVKLDISKNAVSTVDSSEVENTVVLEEKK